jgi:E3 ubiquitin-protein ligase SDIR1
LASFIFDNYILQQKKKDTGNAIGSMKSSDDELTRIVCFEQVTVVWGE